MTTSSAEKKPDTLKINVQFGYKTIILGVIITLAICGGVYFVSTWLHYTLQLRDYIALFSSGIVTTALIYTALGLKVNYNANMQKLAFDKEKFEYEKNRNISVQQRKKREFAYEVSSNWFNDGFADCVQTARYFLQPYKDKLNTHEQITAFEQELNKDLNIRKAIVSVLNYFEYVAILIEDRVIDEEAIKDAFKTVFCDYYKTMRNFIDYHQQASARYFNHYVAVVKRWSDS